MVAYPSKTFLFFVYDFGSFKPIRKKLVSGVFTTFQEFSEFAESNSNINLWPSRKNIYEISAKFLRPLPITPLKKIEGPITFS
jgi:hypothetical protein